MLHILSFALLFAVLTCGQIATADVILPNNCPKLNFLNQFDWTAFQGVWYEFSRFPDFFEDEMICVTQDYKTNDFNISGTLSGVDILSNKKVSFYGDGQIVQTGIYTVTFQGKGNFPKRMNLILGVDYKSYAVIFNCVENNHRHIERAQILTRDRFPDAYTVHKAEEVLAQNNISRRFLVETRQHSCSK